MEEVVSQFSKALQRVTTPRAAPPINPRVLLAGFVVTITPGTAFIWAHLYISGYTYNSDGTRNLGHVSKAIGADLVFSSLAGVVVLLMGLLALRLARRKGSSTASRLLAFASGIGLVLGLAVSGLMASSSTDPTGLQLVVVVTGSVMLSALLCLEFVVVAGTSLRVGANGVPKRPPTTLQRLADRAVLVVAAGGAIAATAWIVQLWIYSFLHP